MQFTDILYFYTKHNATDCRSVKQLNLQKIRGQLKTHAWHRNCPVSFVNSSSSAENTQQQTNHTLGPCSRAFQMYSWVVLPTFTKSACEKNARILGQWMLPGWDVFILFQLTGIFLIITISRGNHGLQSIQQTDFGDPVKGSCRATTRMIFVALCYRHSLRFKIYYTIRLLSRRGLCDVICCYLKLARNNFFALTDHSEVSANCKM